MTFKVFDHYPIDCLHALGSDFSKNIAVSTQARYALVGPVVLAAMSAAVQGVIDIRTPYHQTMPAGLYVTVVAGSGMRKSSVVKKAFEGFEEFEQQYMANGLSDLSYLEQGCHPFVVEDASEAGIVDLFSHGAQSLVMLLDEGGMLQARLDNQRMCKRFDGASLRVLRNRKQVLIEHTRTTFCMTIQGAVFDKLLKSKAGKLMIDSGLMPRMLTSFVSGFGGEVLMALQQDPSLHPANDRIRALQRDYSAVLQGKAAKQVVSLSAEAEEVWEAAQSEWRSRIIFASQWRGLDGFLHRAGEHALRVAAVLQWFTEPHALIRGAYMESAVKLVDWHLRQALNAFGTPTEQELQIRLGRELERYINGKFKNEGVVCFLRVDLLRKGPSILRKAEYLDLAIDQLLVEGKVYLAFLGKIKIINLNINC